MSSNNNKPNYNRKEAQIMTQLPANFGAGSLILSDPAGISNYSMYVISAGTQYLYNHNEDSFVLINSAAFANSIGFSGGGGNCGCYHPWSKTYTANGGTTTTVTVDTSVYNICGVAIGSTIECRSGNNLGLRRTVIDVMNNAGTGTATLTLNSSLPFVYANTDTFWLSTGKFYVWVSNSGLTSNFKYFDIGTGTWTSLSSTSTPTSWGTDAGITSVYQIGAIFATGTATSGGSTTLINSGKTWTTNQWTNYQVRITAGTGIGQIRIIASNTGTTLTVSSSWTINPDATSVYAIEGDLNSLYLVGNNAVTMYKYSISGDSWATVVPNIARSFQPVTGESIHWCGVTGDSNWANESNILDGKYLYSMVGNVTSAIDQFDITASSGSGSWLRINYISGGSSVGEQFGTGTSAFLDGRYLYILWPFSIPTGSIQKLMKYDIIGNLMISMNMDPYLQPGFILGSKIWVKKYDTAGTIKWLYWARQSGSYLQRIMLF